MKRLIFPIILGLGGCAILISLGIWQVQRLDWKEAILADINQRIAAEPVSLPAQVDPEADKYLPVTLSNTGSFTGDRLLVLTSIEDVGPGFRVIESFVLEDESRIMVDRGFVRDGEQGRITGGTPTTLIGNLHWPEESDNWTPDPDGDLWFARDVPAMAEALNAEPLLVVTREVSPADPFLTVQPIDTAGIKNDHLNYAITWFLLAAVWAAMTGALIWRTVRTPTKDAN